MKATFVPLLRCPQCQSSLELHAYKSICEAEVIDGLLKCKCEAAFLITQGVPCMVPPTRLPPSYAQSYRDKLSLHAPALLRLDPETTPEEFSFSLQWNLHAYNDLTWELRLEERVRLFYRYTDLTPPQAQGMRVLDAGCGNGTVSAELALEGMDVVALDYSDGAIRGYHYQLFQSRVTPDAMTRLNFVQGDLQHPPFRDGEFDLIYSDGVLHHTPDTKRTFMEISKKVKPGGRLFVWLYRRDTRGVQTLKRSIVKAVRMGTRWMSYSIRLSLCYGGAFLILLVVRLLRMFSWRGRPVIPLRQKAINLFDTIAPTYNHEHTPAETQNWFREAGYVEVKEVTIRDFRLAEGGFAMIGTRGFGEASATAGERLSKELLARRVIL